jgi:class 3 adenylate cyclase
MSVTKELSLAILIADLSGYTALTETHGNIHAANAVRRYLEIAHGVLQPGARILEQVGDELVLVSEDAGALLRTAIALREAVENEPLFPTLRSGIHVGTVVEQGTSYFGNGLNLTARVAAHARGGQILCTEQLKQAAGELESVSYEPLGSVRFKNITLPVSLFEVMTGLRRAKMPQIDPVCRMQVDPNTAPARLPYNGITYHFCSFDCAKSFAEHPDHYV